MSGDPSPKNPPIYVAWSKTAGPCGHEHASIAAALTCACRFNKSVQHELMTARDMIRWQRGVRRLEDGRFVDLTPEEDQEQQRAAVERAFAPMAAALEQSNEQMRRAPVFARPGSKVFHWESCHHIAGIAPGKRRRFENTRAASAAGLRPCSTCQPIVAGDSEEA